MTGQKKSAKLRCYTEENQNPLLQDSVEEIAVERPSTPFNTAELLARELDSALEEEKQIRECSEGKNNDG